MAVEALVQVGDLGREISQDVLPVAEALIGQTLSLSLEDASTARVEFLSGHELRWEVLSGEAQGRSDSERYFAFSPREHIFFVDCVIHAERATAASAVVDLLNGSITAVVATLPTKTEAYETGTYRLANEGQELPLVRTRFVRGALGRPFVAETHPHVPTTELVISAWRFS